MYDGRIGRWLSVDPEGQHYSPYEGMGNNPISSFDSTEGVDDPKNPKAGDSRTVGSTKQMFTGSIWSEVHYEAEANIYATRVNNNSLSQRNLDVMRLMNNVRNFSRLMYDYGSLRYRLL